MMMEKKINWAEINQGSYPENFLSFAFKDDPEKCKKFTENISIENFRLALRSINGLSRRPDSVEKYFRDHKTIREISIEYITSDETIRHDIRYIAREFTRSLDCQNILLTGENTSSDNMSKDEILNINLYNADLPGVIVRSLMRKGIFTIGDLINHTIFEISRMRNLGLKSQEAIVVMLERYDLELKPCTKKEIEDLRKKHYHCRHMNENYCIYKNECKHKFCMEGEV